jgi:dihydropteroate synthase
MTRERTAWRIRGRTLSFPPTLAIGIVNVTDDSFFSGARSGTPKRAIEDGVELAQAGFDLVDVGAVAARAGPPVPPDREAAALVPAVEGLATAIEAPITVDTFSAEVARRAVEAGAAAINDISGARDPELYDLAAETGCGLVLMHIEGEPRQERPPPRYDDPVDHLRGWFAARIKEATSRGVDPEQLALDPGFDFDLGVGDGLEVLRRLDELRELGRPLFVALSRKDFLGAVLAGSWRDRAPVEEREWATAAATALAVSRGAELLRLHDRSALQALRVADGIAA